MVKRVEYYVAYNWSDSRKVESGFGSIILAINKMPITSSVIKEWKKYISNVSDGANIVIINWIKLSS